MEIEIRKTKSRKKKKKSIPMARQGIDLVGVNNLRSKLANIKVQGVF